MSILHQAVYSTDDESEIDIECDEGHPCASFFEGVHSMPNTGGGLPRSNSSMQQRAIVTSGRQPYTGSMAVSKRRARRPHGAKIEGVAKPHQLHQGFGMDYFSGENFTLGEDQFQE